jgi:hypothetical protein
MADAPAPESPNNAGGGDAPPAAPEHLNIKVTDNNNEVFFKIKRNTKLEKLMLAFCERQGKTLQSVRFLFEGQRVQPSDTPDTVRELSLRCPNIHGLLEGGNKLTIAPTTARDGRRRHPRGPPGASRRLLNAR